MHRDSQKRYYMPGATYFITTVTYERYPYFGEELLCALFADHLRVSVNIHTFKLYAYAIMPDHVHLILKPGDVSNYSIIMGSLKRCFARDANSLLSMNFPGDGIPGDDHDRRLFDYLPGTPTRATTVRLPRPGTLVGCGCVLRCVTMNGETVLFHIATIHPPGNCPGGQNFSRA